MLKQCSSVTLVLCVLIPTAFSGCRSSGSQTLAIDVPADAITPIRGAVETKDLVTCSNELARDLLNTPEIQSVGSRNGGWESPRIVLRSIDNQSRFPFDCEIISSEMRHHLMRFAGDKLRFVERSRGGRAAEPSSDIVIENELQEEGVFDSTGPVTLAGFDFVLRGEVRSHTVTTGSGRDDTVFIFMWLTDRTGTLVWEHEYGPIRRVTLFGPLYRRNPGPPEGSSGAAYRRNPRPPERPGGAAY